MDKRVESLELYNQTDDTEKSLLGCFLIDPDTVKELDNMKEVFYFRKHALIFRAMKALNKRGVGIDYLTLMDELKSNGNFNIIGGSAYLVELTEYVPTSAHFKEYYDILLGKFQSRIMSRILEDVDLNNPKFAHAELQRKIDVVQGYFPTESKEYVDPIFDSFKPFDWGTKEANKEVTSIGNRDYVVFTGEQNSGKTSFMMDMAEKNAKAGRKILFLSLEMNTNDIMSQKAIARAGITKQQYNSKEFSETQQELYFKRQAELYDNENLLIWGMEGADPTVDNIIKRYKQSGAELLVLDNFDKITREKSTSQNQAEADISSKLLEVTKNGMPIVLVHHMRKGDSSKRSIMDIKGSSKIIHDATIVVNGSRLSIPPSLSAEEVKAIPHSDRAVFFLSEWKARMFGTLGVAKTFFHKGTFLDKENWDRENPPLFG